MKEELKQPAHTAQNEEVERSGQDADFSSLEDRMSSDAPSVFQYLNFKTYLKDFYLFKKGLGKGYSYSRFALDAKLASKNYLKRVIDGDRPLSAEFIPKFCRGLKLDVEASQYFEALVHFCQSQDEDAKQHYFDVLKRLSKEKKGSALELVGAQADVLKYWFVFPVRELVNLEDFECTPSNISKKLKNKVTKKQAEEALEILLDAGMIKRDSESGQYVQTHDIVRYSEDVVNLSVRSFHKQMLDRAKVALEEDVFGTWNARALTLSIPKEKYQEVHEKVSDFVYGLNRQYSYNISGTSDLIVQLNCQLLQLSVCDKNPVFKKKKKYNLKGRRMK